MINVDALKNNFKYLTENFEDVSTKEVPKVTPVLVGAVTLPKVSSIIKSFVGDYMISTIDNGDLKDNIETAIISMDGFGDGIIHRCNDKKQGLEYHLKLILDLPSMEGYICIGGHGISAGQKIKLNGKKY